METNEIPKPDSKAFGLPDGFFEQQHKSIAQRTTDLENWSIPGTRSVESCFPVPEGYWFSMEDSIRTQTTKRQITPAYSPVLQWASVAASICLVAGFGIWMKINSMKSIDEWQSKIREIPQEELLAYVGETPSEEREWIELFAARQLGESSLPALDKTETNHLLLEETLEDPEISDLVQGIQLD